jgi:hypothetical protein
MYLRTALFQLLYFPRINVNHIILKQRDNKKLCVPIFRPISHFSCKSLAQSINPDLCVPFAPFQLLYSRHPELSDSHLSSVTTSPGIKDNVWIITETLGIQEEFILNFIEIWVHTVGQSTKVHTAQEIKTEPTHQVHDINKLANAKLFVLRTSIISHRMSRQGKHHTTKPICYKPFSKNIIHHNGKILQTVEDAPGQHS